jgi:hypothetical protein
MYHLCQRENMFKNFMKKKICRKKKNLGLMEISLL